MEEQKQMKDYIVDYLLDGEDEKHLDPVLAEWLAEDESHRKEFDLYKKIWEESRHYTEPSAFDSDLAWEEVDRINRRRVYYRRYWKNILYVASGTAASLLVILVLSFMGVFEKNSDTQVRMSAANGSRSEIVLPDGSMVKLNSGSEVVYAYDSKKKIREVDFQGEGFFDVCVAKLLQKSEMRKNMVMDLIYRGFIYAANYSESHYNPRRSQIKTELRYLFVTTPNR